MPKGRYACLCLNQSPGCVFFAGVLVAPFEVVLDLLGYFWAPQRLVSPLSGLVVAWNLCLAEAFLGEQPTWHDRVATGTILVGAALVGGSIPKTNSKYEFNEIFEHFHRASYLLYAALMLLFALFLVLLLSVQAPEKHTMMKNVQRKCRPTAFAMLAGLIGGQQYFIKIATELFHPWCNTPWFTSAWPWVFCFLANAVAFGGLFVLNEGLRRYDILLLMPTFQATMIASGTASAAAFWGDADGLPTGILVFYVLGVVIALGGVLVLILKVEGSEMGATVGVEADGEEKANKDLDITEDHDGPDCSTSHAPLPNGDDVENEPLL